MAGLRSSNVFDPDYVPPSENAPAVLPGVDPNSTERLPQTQQGEFSKGLEKATLGLRGDLYSAAEAAGQASGQEDLQQWGAEGAQQAYEEASAVPAGNVESIFDVQSIQDFTDWAAHGLGQLAPFALSMVATGGAGALATGALRAATLARGVSAVDRVRKLTAAQKAGGLTGGYLGSAVPSGGAAYHDLKEEGVINPGAAALEGGIIGLLDIAPASHLLSIMGRGKGGVLRGIAEQAPAEAITEAAQEGISEGFRHELVPGYESEDFGKRLVEAASLGALGGGLAGGVSGGVGAAYGRNREPAPRAKTFAAAESADSTYEDFGADTTGLDETDLSTFDRTEFGLQVPVAPNLTLTRDAKDEMGILSEDDYLSGQLDILNRPFTKPGTANKNVVAHQLNQVAEQIDNNAEYAIRTKGDVVGLQIPDTFAELLVPEEEGSIKGSELINRLVQAQIRLPEAEVEQTPGPFVRETLYDRAVREAQDQFPDNPELQTDFLSQQGEKLFRKKVLADQQDRLIELLQVPREARRTEDNAEIEKLQSKLSKNRAPFEALFDPEDPASFLRNFEGVKAPPLSDIREALRQGGLDAETDKAYRKILATNRDANLDLSLEGLDLGHGENGLKILRTVTPNYNAVGKKGYFKVGNKRVNLIKLTNEARRQRQAQEKVYKSSDKPKEEHGFETEAKRLYNDVMIGLGMLAERGEIKLPEGTGVAVPVPGASKKAVQPPGQKALNQLVKMVGKDTVVDAKGRTFGEVISSIATRGKDPQTRRPADSREYGLEKVEADRHIVTGLTDEQVADLPEGTEVEFNEDIRQGEDQFMVGLVEKHGEIESAREEFYKDSAGRKRLSQRLKDSKIELDTAAHNYNALRNEYARLAAAASQGAGTETAAQLQEVRARGLEARKKLRRAKQQHDTNWGLMKDFKLYPEVKGPVDMAAEREKRLKVLRERMKQLAGRKEKNDAAKRKRIQAEIAALEAGEIKGTYLETIPAYERDIHKAPQTKSVRRGEEQYQPPPRKLTSKQIAQTREGVAALEERARQIRKAVKGWDKGLDNPGSKPALMKRDIKWKMSRGMSLRQVTPEQLLAMDNSRNEKLLNKYAKLLKAPKGMRLITAQEVLDYASNESINRILLGHMHGFKTNLPDGSIGIYVHPQLDEVHARQVLAHEMGHAVYEGFIEGTTDGIARAIMQEYMAWRSEFGRDNTKLKDLIHSKKPMKSALYAIGNAGEQRLGDMTKIDVEYNLDFEEWFADRVSQWFETSATPKTGVEKFFAAIARVLKRLAGISPEGTVESLMESIVGGKREWKTHKNVFQRLAASRVADLPAQDRELIERLGGRTLNMIEPEELLHIATIDAADPYGALMHNAFRDWLFRRGPDTKPLVQPHVKNMILRTAMGENVQRQIRTLFKHDREALQQLAIPEASAAYMFQLWKAGLIKVGDRTDTHFHRIAKSFRDSLGIVSDSSNADLIFKQLEQNTLEMTEEGQRTAVQRVLPDSMAETIVKTLGPTYNLAMKPMRSLFFMADHRVRDTGNPHLQELADIMHTPAGRHNSNPTMWSMKQEYMARFENIARRIFEGKDAQFGNETLDYLYGVRNFNDAPAGTQRVIKQVRKLFRMMYDYQVDAGVDVKDLGKTYFPWVFDQEALAEDLDGFREVIMQDKYHKNRVDLAKYINVRDNLNDMIEHYSGVNEASIKEMRDALETFAETGMWTLKDVYPRGELYTHESIGDYMVRNAYTSGQGELDPMPSKGVPALRFSNPRLFKFVDPKEIRPYLSSDLGNTIGRYISQAVKHAEFVRRFGEDAEGLRSLLWQAKEAGATDKEIELAQNYVRASLGTYGRETAEFLHRHFGLALPEHSYTPINEKLNKAMGVGIVYQNLRYLGLSTLTSLGDVMGIAVRSNELSSVYRGIKDYFQRNKNDLSDLAEMLGVIEHSQISDALGWRYDGMYLTGGLRKTNDTFFKLIGLEAWTRATRLMGLSAGQSFIVKHAHRPTKNSERWLQELNLTADDVILTEDGKLRILTHAERRRASKEELQRDDRVRSALIQFTDEAILRPNASMRTLWGSDPHFQLFQYLKSFMYTFHERILKRVGHEAMEGNYAAFVWLLSYIPVMIAADLMREAIQFGPEGDPRKAGWGFWDHTQHGAIRAGLLGYAQQGLEINNDLNMGGYGLGGFAATFDTLADIPDILSMEDGALLSALPGQTVYREWF